MRTYKGLKVPVEPKWMVDGYSQPICADIVCVGINCRDCIYSLFNTTAREQFYEEAFKEPEKENKEESFMESLARKAVKRNLPDLNTDTIPVEFVPKEKLSEGTLIGKWYNCITLIETDKGLVIRGTDSWTKKEENEIC